MGAMRAKGEQRGIARSRCVAAPLALAGHAGRRILSAHAEGGSVQPHSAGGSAGGAASGSRDGGGFGQRRKSSGSGMGGAAQRRTRLVRRDARRLVCRLAALLA